LEISFALFLVYNISVYIFKFTLLSVINLVFQTIFIFQNLF